MKCVDCENYGHKNNSCCNDSDTTKPNEDIYCMAAGDDKDGSDYWTDRGRCK